MCCAAALLPSAQLAADISINLGIVIGYLVAFGVAATVDDISEPLLRYLLCFCVDLLYPTLPYSHDIFLLGGDCAAQRCAPMICVAYRQQGM